MNISILGIPMDLGAGRRGVDMGASALRNAQLAYHLRELGHTVSDLGDIHIPIPESLDKYEDQGLTFLEQVLAACSSAYQQLSVLPANTFPIALGGDHSVSMGTVAGAAQGKRTGIIWVDAHADFNTPESSPSGNIHGMPVAHLTGLGDPRLSGIAPNWHARPEDIAMIGLRSVDAHERELVREAGIAAYTMKDVDQKGITYLYEEIMERMSHVERLHVSYDADALDPSVCPGVGTPVPGGLTYREGHLLMELLSESGRVTSLDLVEVNPVLDVRNHTAEVMVGMAASLLGQRIL